MTHFAGLDLGKRKSHVVVMTAERAVIDDTVRLSKLRKKAVQKGATLSQVKYLRQAVVAEILDR